MNPIIDKQLKKCKVAIIPEYNESTKTLHIPRIIDLPELSYTIGHYYIIELENYIIHPPENFSLHQNWNNNNIPKSKYYKCECLQLMGKMIKINGVGFDWDNQLDLNDLWTGWLPMKSVKILKEI